MGELKWRIEMERSENKSFPAIRKFYYPNCIGRAGIWALSPLGLNVLIALYKGNTLNKYVNVHNELQSKTICKLRNAAFYQSSGKHEILKNITFGNVDVKEVDFSKSSARENIKQWVNQGNDFKEFDIEKSIPTDTTLALLNYANLKISWNKTTSKGRQMKIHNSFKYTQDVNYEARILELPLEEQHFRFVVLVPNEMDLLHTLYRRLIKEGLEARFASFQPIFTINSVLRAPDVAIKSETHISLKEEMLGDVSNESLIQFASVTADQNGVHAKVLSCLYSRKSKPTLPDEPNSQPENRLSFLQSHSKIWSCLLDSILHKFLLYSIKILFFVN